MPLIRRLRVPRRIKYVLVEMVLISLGLLLALGIDNLVEWRQQLRTVGQARAALRVEIETNAAKLDKVMREIEIGRTQTWENLQALKDLQNTPDPQGTSKPRIDSSLGLNFLDEIPSLLLRETAWLTAQTTGALSYMSYAEAQTYNSIYEVQAEFHRRQRLLLDDAALIVGVANQVRRSGTPLNAAGASELVRCYASMGFHLNILYSSARRLSGLLRTTLGTPSVPQPGSTGAAVDPKK